MAEKRMFSKKIIDTDWFMDMPASTQNLYFHLSMRADDDGFVASPRRIIKLVGASEDDYKLLIAKSFVIPFDSGVCVITDWRINNYLRADRYTETMYQEEKSKLSLDENGKYNLGIPSGIPDVNLEYSNSISNSISNSNINNNSTNKESTNKRFVPPTLEEVANYCEERGNDVDPQRFIDFYESKGWFIGKNKVKDWKACIRTWERREDSVVQLDKPSYTQKVKPNYETRKYTEEQLGSLFTNLDEVEI